MKWVVFFLSLRTLYFLWWVIFLVFIYLFVAVLGVRCCVWAFSRVVSGGSSPVAVLRLLIAVACCKARARDCRLRSCDAQA